MEPIGYRGIAFMPTGRAALLLENGDWLTLTAGQAENLVRDRAEEGLPPIPVIDRPAVLPMRDPLRRRPGPKNRRTIELPPSVITEPLMVWRGTGSDSLTCTRVIPYPDGFEIELVAQGLLIEDAEIPRGRSSRGFWHFEGLQLTVGFADGRSHRVADLTSDPGRTRDGHPVSPRRLEPRDAVAVGDADALRRPRSPGCHMASPGHRTSDRGVPRRR